MFYSRYNCYNVQLRGNSYKLKTVKHLQSNTLCFTVKSDLALHIIYLFLFILRASKVARKGIEFQSIICTLSGYQVLCRLLKAINFSRLVTRSSVNKAKKGGRLVSSVFIGLRTYYWKKVLISAVLRKLKLFKAIRFIQSPCPNIAATPTT